MGMGIALSVTLVLGAVICGCTWLWFRVSHARPADPDIATLVKQRRSTFEEKVQSSEKYLRKP